MTRRRVVPVDEVVCRLDADGHTLHTFHCTAERYVDLTAGWLVGAGRLEAARAPEASLDLQWTSTGPVVTLASTHERRQGEARAIDAGAAVGPARRSPPRDLPAAFREMYARARRYHESGGIHAAAVFRDGELVAFAEDVGRHNAVDKAIGAAARAAHALHECGLVTSARVSGEMARKCAQAGLGWIASRSVPTTLALANAARAGVTIVARAASPEARAFPPTARPLGVVMAGGGNTRFGGPKTLEEVAGRRIVDRVTDALRAASAHVVMITNTEPLYASVELEKRPDRDVDAGPVAGLRAALAWAQERGLPGVLVVACDMPFVPVSLLDALWTTSAGADGAVPRSDSRRGVEPLCAAYRVSCLPAIEHALAQRDLRVVGFFERANIVQLDHAIVAEHGDPARIFFNVNTREELERARAFADEAAADGA
ncbi:MAG TPA: formate dehydrogenase accessory sulfurtransferase FdhD [Longimicrobiales bacterium]